MDDRPDGQDVEVTVEAYRARAHYGPEEGYFSLDGVEEGQRRVGAVTQFHRPPPASGRSGRVCVSSDGTRSTWPRLRSRRSSAPNLPAPTFQPASHEIYSSVLHLSQSRALVYASPIPSLVPEEGPTAREWYSHPHTPTPAAPFPLLGLYLHKHE